MRIWWECRSKPNIKKYSAVNYLKPLFWYIYSEFHLNYLNIYILFWQPYPMYPATTSLVNVVPKLSSTGRDLLQVKYFHRGINELMISCFSWILLCLFFAESSEMQSSTANFSRGSPTAPVLCWFLPTLNVRSPWHHLGTQMGQSYLVKPLQHLQRSVIFQFEFRSHLLWQDRGTLKHSSLYMFMI